MNNINNIDMKQIYILLVAMCVIAFTACSKDDDNDPSNGDGEEGVITMVHETDYSYRNPIRISLGIFNEEEIITIDWGDGNVEKFKGSDPGSYNDICFYMARDIEHRYLNSNPYIITIKGKIGTFSCSSKHITSLDITKCPALVYLDCRDSNLTSLDVSQCPALVFLCCDYSNLTSLDVTKCLALTKLYCGNNNLTSLDVTKCPALTSLSCGYNNLTSLDVSQCPALGTLYCDSNNLSASALDKIFNDLPIKQGSIHIQDNPGADNCDKRIVEYKGWYIYL